jgi:hypothetical protein
VLESRITERGKPPLKIVGGNIADVLGSRQGQNGGRQFIKTGGPASELIARHPKTFLKL